MEDTAISELYVVRHGQSTWNVESRFTGQVDAPLSPAGHEQAAALARRCLGLGLDAVVTSDLKRARATGQAVANHLGLPEPVGLPLLRERWSRDLQGMAREDIEARYPGQIAAWREARPISLPGENEAYDAFATRVTEGLREAAGHGRRVLVVAHAGMFVVLDQLTGRAEAGGVANAEGRHLQVLPDGVIEVGDAFRPTGAVRSGFQDP